jgi:hypothetical protein
MTTSRTARVWVNELRNKKTILETEEYFKFIFTQDEYDEFYFELVAQTKECIRLEFISLNILPKNEVLNEIFVWMDEHINYYDVVRNILDSIYTEVFQSVSGFFGKGCTDSQFEEVRDAMGDFSWGEQMDVYEYLLTEENHNVTDWARYVAQIEKKVGFCLPCNTPQKEKETLSMKEKFTTTEIVSLKLKQNGANLIYALINTSEYDGSMGIIVVEGISPRILENYGFDNDDIMEIARLEVGDSWNTHFMYGKGVVVTRIA